MIGYELEAYGELAAGIERVLITREEIDDRIRELGQAISRDYEGENPLLVGVLKGVVPFMADLLRAITIPVEVDFIDITRFQPGSAQRGAVRLEKDLNVPIEGRHVLFVEDVIDTGMTLNYLLGQLRARRPVSLEVCACFNKLTHRLVNIPLRYKGFDLPDMFVVGYGLDYREQFRNLPFIGLLRAEVFQNHK